MITLMGHAIQRKPPGFGVGVIMAFASLTVTAPKNRLIFLNGNYDDPAGNSSKDKFVVPAGGNIAETLNSRRQVDFRNQFRVGPADTSVTVALDPVLPPEPV